jgi:3'(2'), 5'-bisphosphate nucleotidase
VTDRQTEYETAIEAVRAASRVCRTVQNNLIKADALEKKDKSPVTVADFASQAIICQRLAKVLPGDRIVGEEDAGELWAPAQETLRAAVARHVNTELDEPTSIDEILAWIDRGRAEASGARYWTLDPIDGTKGFLRRQQYAVALALIENNEVVLGILGCPNLPASSGAHGTLFVATPGDARELPLWDSDLPQGDVIRVAAVSSADQARFCESVESGHSDQDESARIAALLGITSEPFRIDSQCKYATVARGDASIYLRMPTRADYQEKIWDHAAGKLVVEAAGGKVTDINGKPLDFRHGRTLRNNSGVVATSGKIHAQVIEAIREVRG